MCFNIVGRYKKLIGDTRKMKKQRKRRKRRQRMGKRRK